MMRPMIQDSAWWRFDDSPKRRLASAPRLGLSRVNRPTPISARRMIGVNSSAGTRVASFAPATAPRNADAAAGIVAARSGESLRDQVIAEAVVPQNAPIHIVSSAYT